MSAPVQTPYVKLWIEEGIIYAVYANDLDCDLDIAKAVVAERIKLAAGKSYPCLIDMRGVRSASKEARAYFANEGAAYITVSALITGNVFTRTLAHLFITVNNPKVPIHLFGDVESARKWLMQFISSNKKLEV